MNMRIELNKTSWTNLAVYGLMHGVVDFISAAVLFSIIPLQLTDKSFYIFLILLYIILAFGTQPLLGVVIDHIKKPRIATLLGMALIAEALVLFSFNVFLCVLFIGFGNAFFHVGAGSITLNVTPKQATAPGIFVAPGALGLLAGTLLGKTGNFVTWPFLLVLLIGAVLILILKSPILDYVKNTIPTTKTKPLLIAIALIFTTILIRSLVGTVLDFSWKSQINLLIVFTFAVFLGKALGGWLADKFGWGKITIGGLLLSAPLLVFAKDIPALAILGIFLFNFTMPVTLVALSNLFPGRPGFAFGLTCFALMLGAIPVFIGVLPDLTAPITLLVLIMTAALSLFIALPYINTHRK